MRLLFYTPKTTPRVEYIVSTLFSAIGLTSCQITTDAVTFRVSPEAKINYSSNRITFDEIWFSPVQLLFENAISEQTIDCFNWNNTKAFYKTEGDFQFDIFAASFYLITRYEEYLPHNLDEYGRYSHKNSLAYKEAFLKLPLVNLWLQEFKNVLSQRFNSIVFKPSSFQFIPTYDIDIAWSYLQKGFIRNAGSAIKSLLKGDLISLKERIGVLSRSKKDPFDIYDWLDHLHQQSNLKPYYFFLLAKEHKGYDRNIAPSNVPFRDLIKQTASKYDLGIHPSWQSVDVSSSLKSEIKTLEEIVGDKIVNSRQHYIRMTLPTTYRNLIAEGIKADFSMGYGRINGFRASYCLPYQWYDLGKETTTKLTIYPFCFMEANSYFEQKYTLKQATEELQHYYSITKQVNGTLITIFHNHTLGNKQAFDGWMEMYEEFCLKVV